MNSILESTPVSHQVLSLHPPVLVSHEIGKLLAESEVDAFGALGETDSSCWGQTRPCNKTCC